VPHCAWSQPASVTSVNTGKHLSPARVGRPDLSSFAESTFLCRSDTPNEAKALVRNARIFDEDLWKENPGRLVTEGNIAKFRQNPDLKAFLLQTGDAVLVEARSYGRIWGIGLKANDERATHPATWQGQKLLGFALMDVREALRCHSRLRFERQTTTVSDLSVISNQLSLPHQPRNTTGKLS